MCGVRGWVVLASNLVDILQCKGQPLTTKNCLAPNGNNVGVEKLSSNLNLLHYNLRPFPQVLPSKGDEKLMVYSAHPIVLNSKNNNNTVCSTDTLSSLKFNNLYFEV